MHFKNFVLPEISSYKGCMGRSILHFDLIQHLSNIVFVPDILTSPRESQHSVKSKDRRTGSVAWKHFTFENFSLGTYLSLYKIEKLDRRERIFNEIIQASADTGSSFSPVKIKVSCILTKKINKK